MGHRREVWGEEPVRQGAVTPEEIPGRLAAGETVADLVEATSPDARTPTEALRTVRCLRAICDAREGQPAMRFELDAGLARALTLACGGRADCGGDVKELRDELSRLVSASAVAVPWSVLRTTRGHLWVLPRADGEGAVREPIPVALPRERRPASLHEVVHVQRSPTVFRHPGECERFLQELRARGVAPQLLEELASGLAVVALPWTPSSLRASDEPHLSVCHHSSNDAQLAESRNLVFSLAGGGVLKIKGVGKREGFSPVDNRIIRESLPDGLPFAPISSEQGSWGYFGAQTQRLAQESVRRSILINAAVDFLHPELSPCVPKVLQATQVATVRLGDREVPYVEAIGDISNLGDPADYATMNRAATLIEGIRAQLVTQAGEAGAKLLRQLDALSLDDAAGVMARGELSKWLRERLPDQVFFYGDEGPPAHLGSELAEFDEAERALRVRLMLHAKVFVTIVGNPSQTLEWEPSNWRNMDLLYFHHPGQLAAIEGFSAEVGGAEFQELFIEKLREAYALAMGDVELELGDLREAPLEDLRDLPARLRDLNEGKALLAFETELTKLSRMLSSLVSINCDFSGHRLQYKDTIGGVVTDFADLQFDHHALPVDLAGVYLAWRANGEALCRLYGQPTTSVEPHVSDFARTLREDARRVLEADQALHRHPERAEPAFLTLAGTQLDATKLARLVKECAALQRTGASADLLGDAVKLMKARDVVDIDADALTAFFRMLDLAALEPLADEVLGTQGAVRWRVWADHVRPAASIAGTFDTTAQGEGR